MPHEVIHVVGFKDDFHKAATDNKVSKADQVDKLREYLTGKAAQALPKNNVKNISEAWKYLKQAYSNSFSALSHRLNKIRITPAYPTESSRTTP